MVSNQFLPFFVFISGSTYDPEVDYIFVQNSNEVFHTPLKTTFPNLVETPRHIQAAAPFGGVRAQVVEIPENLDSVISLQV